MYFLIYDFLLYLFYASGRHSFLYFYAGLTAAGSKVFENISSEGKVVADSFIFIFNYRFSSNNRVTPSDIIFSYFYKKISVLGHQDSALLFLFNFLYFIRESAILISAGVKVEKINEKLFYNLFFILFLMTVTLFHYNANYFLYY